MEYQKPLFVWALIETTRKDLFNKLNCSSTIKRIYIHDHTICIYHHNRSKFFVPVLIQLLDHFQLLSLYVHWYPWSSTMTCVNTLVCLQVTQTHIYWVFSLTCSPTLDSKLLIRYCISELAVLIKVMSVFRAFTACASPSTAASFDITVSNWRVSGIFDSSSRTYSMSLRLIQSYTISEIIVMYYNWVATCWVTTNALLLLSWWNPFFFICLWLSST